MTTMQACLAKLIEGKQGKSFRWKGKTVPPGKVPLPEFVNFETGGSDGPRRIRQLRLERNIVAECEYFSVPVPGEFNKDGSQKMRRTTVYELITPVEHIDPVGCRLVEDRRASGNEG